MARTPPGYYLHLVAWAQIGVLIRVYLAELFGSACPSVPWAPCLTSNGSRYGGASFTDLPANILGSFLMGLFVSSDVLSNSLKHILSVEAPLAMLPVRSPLQEHLAFQVGLRTGLCGSLTTFASWLTQMVLMITGGHNTTVLPHTQWVEALGGLLVGTFAASAALVLGQHVALLLYHKLNPDAFVPYGSPAPEQNKVDGLDQRQQQQQQLLEEAGPEAAAGSFTVERQGSQGQLRQLRTVSSTQQGSLTVVVVEGDKQQQQVVMQQQQVVMQQQQAPQGQVLQSLTSFRDPPVGSLELAQLRRRSQGSGISLHADPHVGPGDASAGAAAAAAGAGVWQHAGQQQHPGVPAAAGATGSGSSSAGVSGDAAMVMNGGYGAPVVEETEQPATTTAQLLVDGFAVLAIAVLTGVSLWRIIQGNTGHTGNTGLHDRDAPFAQEWFWWSILFGPLGCYGRYYLSRYNGKLPGDWSWFPLGTFTANIAACVIDYVMKVVPVRHPLDRTSAAVLAGVVGGVGGCLSTVSTWVVEIQRLMLSFPKTSHGYQYIFISLGTALALGLLIYGVPVWTLV